VAEGRGARDVEERDQRQNRPPKHPERQVVPRQGDDHRDEQGPGAWQAIAQDQRQRRAEQSVQGEVDGESGERLDGEAAVDRARPVNGARHQILRRPEASLLPGRRDSQPRQHPEDSQNAAVQTGQKRGDG